MIAIVRREIAALLLHLCGTGANALAINVERLLCMAFETLFIMIPNPVRRPLQLYCTNCGGNDSRDL
jgi:hypothetical protein